MPWEAEFASIRRFSRMLETVTSHSYGTFSVHATPIAGSRLLEDLVAASPVEPAHAWRAWLAEVISDWDVAALERSANVEAAVTRGFQRLEATGHDRDAYLAALADFRGSLSRLVEGAREVRRGVHAHEVHRFLLLGDAWISIHVHCDAHLD